MDIHSISSISATKQAEGSKVNQTNNADFSKELEAAKKNSTTLDAIFQKAAKKYGVDVNLLKAIGKAESDFNTKSTSHCGAQGIMQLMPATAKFLGVKDSYDPEQNIMGGAKYISRLIKQYDGNTTLALAAYNAGSGNVRKYGGVPPFEETQNYIKKINRFMKEGVVIPESRNQVTLSSGNDYSQYENVTQTTTSNASKEVTPSTDASVAIVNLSPEQESRFQDLKTESDLLDSLQTLLSKLNQNKDNIYTYEDYARYMQVYLDGIAVSNLSGSEKQKEELTASLDETLSQIRKNLEIQDTAAPNEDALLASQSITYNKTVLDLLTGTTEQ
ncbi:MAG: lytic transglycosylase domain-containing protein [Acetivibrio ethanolgignens]